MIQLAKSRQPIHAIERHGIPFYILAYRPDDVWVAGVDISRHLGFKNARRHAYKTYQNNEEWLAPHSRIIEIPRKIGKHGPPPGGDMLDQNIHETRIYDEIGFNFFVSVSNTRKGKSHLIKILAEYQKLKKQLQKKPVLLPWQQAREEGKLLRRAFTDIIKLFCAYAEAAGSKNFRHYYRLTTDKMRKRLGVLDKTRDEYSRLELAVVSEAEEKMGELILDLMDRGVHYKEIFKQLDAALDGPAVVIDVVRTRIIGAKC